MNGAVKIHASQLSRNEGACRTHHRDLASSPRRRPPRKARRHRSSTRRQKRLGASANQGDHTQPWRRSPPARSERRSCRICGISRHPMQRRRGRIWTLTGDRGPRRTRPSCSSEKRCDGGKLAAMDCVSGKNASLSNADLEKSMGGLESSPHLTSWPRRLSVNYLVLLTHEMSMQPYELVFTHMEPNNFGIGVSTSQEVGRHRRIDTPGHGHHDAPTGGGGHPGWWVFLCSFYAYSIFILTKRRNQT